MEKQVTGEVLSLQQFSTFANCMKKEPTDVIDVKKLIDIIISDRYKQAMELIRKSLAARALPPIEEILEDEWLDNLRDTPSFAQFLNALEAKLQAREQ